MMFFHEVSHTSRPCAEQGREIGLVEVDDSKAMYFSIIDVFGNHGCDDLLPPMERISSGGTIVENREMDVHDLTSFRGQIVV